MASSKKKRPAAAPPPPAPVRNVARAEARQQSSQKREAQKAAKARAQRRAALRKRLLAGGLALLLVGLVAGFVVNERRQSAALRDRLTAGGACRTDDRTDPTRPAGQNHIPSPTYAVDPPAGGDHTPGVARSGVFAGETVPEDGPLVHALEHGYVVVWHQPDLDDEDKERLEAFAEERSPDVIVVERPTLDVPVAATAWGQRLLCDELQTEALATFFDEYVDEGPEDVERT